MCLHADLGTGTVRQASIRLEGDIYRVDERFQLLCRLGAKCERDQGVGIPVALQDMHVLVSTVSGRLRTEEIRIILMI